MELVPSSGPVKPLHQRCSISLYVYGAKKDGKREFMKFDVNDPSVDQYGGNPDALSNSALLQAENDWNLSPRNRGALLAFTVYTSKETTTMGTPDTATDYTAPPPAPSATVEEYQAFVEQAYIPLPGQVATVEDANVFTADPGQDPVPMNLSIVNGGTSMAAALPVPTLVEVLAPGTAGLGDIMLQMFLQKIGMSKELFDKLPPARPAWIDAEFDDLRGMGSTQADIRRAAESHFRKVKWEGDRKAAHEESKAITAGFGLKYLHFKDKGVTVAYSHIALDPANPDSDWLLVLSMACANFGEPYCRKDGKAFAAKRFAEGRRMSINTSMLPGETKPRAASKVAWQDGKTKERLVQSMVGLVASSFELFGLRRGDKEDDGSTPEGRAAAKALTKARRQRIRAAELALEEARKS